MKHGYTGIIFPLFYLIIYLLKGKFTDQMMELNDSVKAFFFFFLKRKLVFLVKASWNRIYI